jgi:hypothetical protein
LNFSFEKFLWDDICAYGGWVNLEHYGYGGAIRGVYSRAARLSAFRAYLCNALRVEGGWFGVANSTAWEFEVFGRQAYDNVESSHGITFNQTVFQSEDASNAGNGLRISECVREVTINAYFESHKVVAGGGGIALMVGCNRAGHPSPEIPIEVDITDPEKDAPTNDPRYAARHINLSGCTGGYAGGTTAPTQGSRFVFGNVRGITWGTNGFGGRWAEYSEHTHDIRDYPLSNHVQYSTSLSGVGGTTTDDTVAAGIDVIPVVATTMFGVGEVVYVNLVDISGRYNVHESTVSAIDPGVSITINDAIPTGRSVASGALVSRNKLDRIATGLGVADELNRGGEAAVNLLPAGNFVGTISAAPIAGYVHGVKSNGTSIGNGRALIATDTTVKRHGRPTLKVTRKGTVIGGAQTCRFILYPHGNESLVQTGVPIVVAGWMLMEDVSPYNSTDFSSSATYDLPMIGLTTHDGTTETHMVGSAAGYPKAGEWYPFLYTFTINDPNVTRLGINFLPSAGSGWNWTTDASVWFDSLGIFINPRSYQDIINGNYSHHASAGRFEAGTFHWKATQAEAAATIADTNVYHAVGDTVTYTDPLAGQVEGKKLTTTGWRDFGVIAV